MTTSLNDLSEQVVEPVRPPAPQPGRASAGATALTFAFFAGLMLVVLLLYTLLHEGGHALLGVLFGGTVNNFSANFFNMSAHVGIDGTFSLAQQALISAAGVSLPILALVIFLALAPRRGSPIFEWFRLLVFMVAVNSLLAWVVIPWLASAGQTIGDDSANFLGYTGFHPALISGAALAFYVAVWALFLNRAGGLSGLRSSLRTLDLQLTSPASRRALAMLGVVGAVALALTVGLSAISPGEAFPAPEGYTLQTELDLSQSRFEDAPVYTFTLSEPATLNLFVSLVNVKGGPVLVRLVGPDGYNNTLLSFMEPDFDAGRASVHPQDLPLAAGEYQLRVTFQTSRKGRVEVYSLLR